MIDDIPIGTGLSRDIATGEEVEGEIDAMISRRHDRRVLEEGERPAQEMWAASVRRYNMRRGLLPRLLAAARTKKLELELRRVEEKLVPAQEASA